MKKDLVIGLVGTAILVTAMVGVFRFEAAQGGSAFSVTFSTTTTELTPVDRATNEGESTPEGVDVATRNATVVEFVLSWSDDTANSLPDEFNLTVVSPTGATRATQGSGSPLTVRFEAVNVLPPQTRVLAGSQEEAHARAALDYTGNAGVGSWNVTIQLVSAGDVGQASNPAPVLQDTGNSWTLTPKVTAYAAQLSAE